MSNGDGGSSCSTINSRTPASRVGEDPRKVDRPLAEVGEGAVEGPVLDVELRDPAPMPVNHLHRVPTRRDHPVQVDLQVDERGVGRGHDVPRHPSGRRCLELVGVVVVAGRAAVTTAAAPLAVDSRSLLGVDMGRITR